MEDSKIDWIWVGNSEHYKLLEHNEQFSGVHKAMQLIPVTSSYMII